MGFYFACLLVLANVLTVRAGSDICQNGNGEDYRGRVSKTKSGLTCQKWTSQSPNKHNFNSLGGHNYCRNPDGHHAVWCYTTNPSIRWELCDVPQCGNPGDYKASNEITLNELYWGRWGPIHTCSYPHFVYKMELKIEQKQWGGDDTALNAIRLTCSDGRTISSTQQKWGYWREGKACSKGSLMNKAQIRRERKQGSGDDSGGNGVRFQCTDGKKQYPGDGYWGQWSHWESCQPGSAVYGIQTRVEPAIKGDDTALNDVVLYCARFPQGNSRVYKATNAIALDMFFYWGRWGPIHTCSYPHFVHKMELKIEQKQGDGDDTALNAIRLTCSDGHTISSTQQKWGYWRGEKACSKGSFMNKAQIRREYDSDDDNSGGNGVRFQCTDGKKQYPGDGYWGKWSPWESCQPGSAVYGIQTRVEFAIAGDDTALNNVRFYCARFPQGSGKEELILYEHFKRIGREKTIFGPTPVFSAFKFNDIVTAVRAVKGDWELYTHSGYWGNRMVVEEGTGKVQAYHNDQYTSARPICKYVDDPSTAKIRIYQHSSLQGEHKEFLNEVKNLHKAEAGNWGDKVSSVRAIKGDWELYDHPNYKGRREEVKEGQVKNVKLNDIHSSLRPICETYSPKCKPTRIEIIGSGNKIYAGTRILGPTSAFSCSGPATSTLSLRDVDSVTESISVGFSESKEINWSVGLSVSLSYGKAVTAGPVETSKKITITASANYGESYTVSHSEAKTFSEAVNIGMAKYVAYDTPGGAIVFGTVDKYTVDNSDVPVNVHVECNGKPNIIKSSMNLRNSYYKTAHFGSFSKKATEENCKQTGYYTRADRCVQNVKEKYLNKIGKKEEMKKQFDDCFL